MKKLLISLALIITTVWFAPIASAVTVVNCEAAGISNDQCAVADQHDLDYDTGAKRIWSIIQIVLAVLGGIAVIMIVIGGIRYALSQGESAALTAAKNTILYSVIGLVVAICASGIVLLVQSFFLK